MYYASNLSTLDCNLKQKNSGENQCPYILTLQGRSQDLLSGEAIPYRARSAQRTFC